MKNIAAVVSFLSCAVAVGVGLLGASPVGAADKHVPVFVRFDRPPSPAALGAVSKHAGRIRQQFKIVPAVSATVPAASLARLRQEPGVVAVELDGPVQAHAVTWGVGRIGCEAVHSGTFAAEGAVPITGAGVRVAVIDTGIDYTHPRLAPRYAGGYDFVNGDNDPWDDHYHGTHVAGTIGAVDDGVLGIAVAPNVDLYALKVLGSNGSGSWSGVVAGLDWCVDNGIQVANLSLGSQFDPGSTVKAAFDNAYAAGLVIVASAGNEGAGTDTVGYPARYAAVIAVGSTTESDGLSYFSSTGPTVELAAPGSDVYSTYPGGGYAYLSGTSMAAPHVAGVAALLLDAGMTDLSGDGRVNDDLRFVLQATAEDFGASGRDPQFGFGLVDAEYAVVMSYDQEGGPVEPPPQEVFDAPSNLAGSALGTEVTLTWLDNANVESGYELDYGVKVKGSTSWSSLGATVPDDTSFTSTLPSGTYRFRVRAFRLGDPSTVTAWSNEVQLTVGQKGKKR